RRHAGFELISMRLEPAMLSVDEGKRKGIESLFCAQPDKAAFTHVDIRLKGVGITGANPAVQAIGGDHQICIIFLRDFLIVGDIGFEYEFHSDLFTPCLQNIEQFLATDANKPMAAAAQAAV